MPFFNAAPRRNKGNIYSVKDVQDEIAQFKLLYEVDPKLSSVNSCNNVDKATYWRKYVRDATINAMSTPVELDFFEKIAGGKTELIPAKEMTFRQSADYDRNIYSKGGATGLVAGGEATFTLLRANHSVSGLESYAAVGYELFIYEDQQWVRVMDVDRSNPYAHRIKVRPKNKLYTVNIRANRKMLVSPATQVGGFTCNNDFTGEHRTPGYMYKMTMLRLRVQWKQAIDLMKGYTDVLQFGIMFDNEGKEIDCWEYYKKIKAQENLKYAFNTAMFLGQKVDNPDIFVEAMGGDESYPGFDGYSQQVQNGGGIVYPYDPQYGIDPYADMSSILLRQDSMKRTKEFTILRSLPFQMAFDRNFAKVLKVGNGDCSYETFRHTDAGNNKENITRMGINSVNLWNLTIHFKDFDALSDSRSIGNADMPYWAYMMPTTGLRDSNGRSVPPIEFFTNKGCGATGQYEEHTYDARKERSGCEEIGGWMSKTIGMVVHGLQDHVIFKPRKRC
jgi:hypothetical protein